MFGQISFLTAQGQ